MKETAILPCLSVACLATTAVAIPAFAANPFEDARAALMKAYDAKDYKGLSNLLDQDIVFRGSVKPDLWTSRRDNVITTSWGSAKTCGALETSPEPLADALVGHLSVPTHTLVLTPDAPTGSVTAAANNQSIAVDTGKMFMPPRTSEPNVPPYQSRYIMVWRDTGSGWKPIHMDMHAAE